MQRNEAEHKDNFSRSNNFDQSTMYFRFSDKDKMQINF